MTTDGVQDTTVKETVELEDKSVERSPDSKAKHQRSSEVDYDKRKKRRQRGIGDAVMCRPLEVVVRDDRVEQAIRQLKNRMAREGVLRELKNRRHYFKPSELKRIKRREAARRRRKQARQKPH